MISVDEAVKILRDEESYSTSEENFNKGIWTNIDIPIDKANQIAELIEHLQSKCDLEVNELLAGGCE